MAVLPIVIYPDKRLETKTTPVDEITAEVLTLLDDMYETMLANDGIGIAAPQVGSNLRIAIVEMDEESGLIEMINPVVHSEKGKDVDIEGCLSFPEIYGTVERAYEVVVRYFDREGQEIEIEADDYLARALLHEIEHLEGQLFTDKIIERIDPSELEAYMEED
ncbi:peptide deformylase [Isobaculum melis]|uniref:Peptide deformylase n=1 Tax=Isobaculum melis TaxID=142588 RepID=A0A1H9RAC8_9LACT|nr:peptide deformylase [Isobaculum melis]SER69577.1 peptide deformylase [Isobaculum melis]